MSESNEMTVRPIDVEVSEQALARIEPNTVPNLFGAATAVEVLGKATEIATALKQVISQQGLISRISGKEYPRCEAWTLCGTMLGVFPVLTWTKQVTGGWEARVEAKTRDGAVVGAAEAQCLRTEKNWKDRDDFAIRSMAQTRATAKALRMPLGFIMTLAGYESTPAEEMTFSQEPKPAPQPTARPSEPGMGWPQAGPGSSGPKNYVVRPAPTAEDWKLSFLKLSKERKMEYWAWKWALDHGLLPNEPLRDIPADLVPTTRSGQVQLVDSFKALMDEAIKVGGPDPEDVEAFYKANEEDQIPGLEVKKESALPDSRPRVEGEIAYVSVKGGKKKNGDPWTSYGIKINDKYYNTFSNTLGQKAAALKEQVVTLIYTEEERGNKAQALIWNGETTNAGES